MGDIRLYIYTGLMGVHLDAGIVVLAWTREGADTAVEEELMRRRLSHVNKDFREEAIVDSYPTDQPMVSMVWDGDY